MRYFAGAYTDIGNSRESNQDSFCILRAKSPARGNVLMAVVCDGMGGLSKGEVASGTVVTAFSDWFVKDLSMRVSECSLKQVAGIWTEMLHGLNDRLSDYGRAEEIRVGTTFSGLLLIGQEYLWVHVGDSRIYLLREGETRQITSDHTVANRERAKRPDGPLDRRRGNMLTQCVGASMNLKPDWGTGKLRQMDRFLLCSDGFYHRLEPEDIQSRMGGQMESEAELTALCRDLSRKMMERGEKDNVTAAMIGVKEDVLPGAWRQKLEKIRPGDSFSVDRELIRTHSREILT